MKEIKDTYGKIQFLGYDDVFPAELMRKPNGKFSILFQDTSTTNYGKLLRNRFEIIHGAFTGLGNVTLINSELIGEYHGFGGTKLSIQPEYLITDMNVDSLDDLAFNSATFSIDQYIDFFNMPFYDVTYNDKNEIENATFYHPEVLPIEVSKTMGCAIHFGRTISFGGNLSAEQYIAMKLTSDDKIHLLRYKQIAHRLNQFLSLVSGKRRNVHIGSFSINVSGEKSTQHFCYSNQMELSPSTLFYGRFRYEKVKEHFGSALGKWLFSPELGSIGDLLLAKFNGQALDVEMSFLNSCYAMESIHRTFFDYKEMDEDDYKKRLGLVLRSIEDRDFRTLLKNKSQYGHEPSFRNRLKKLFAPLEGTKYSFSTAEIHWIVETRNNLVHQLKGDVKHVTKDLYTMSDRLDNTIRYIVFKQIGLVDVE